MKSSVEFEFTTRNGILILVRGEATIIDDLNYGADADGNRGRHTRFVEDIEFEYEAKDGSPKPELDQKEVGCIERVIADNIDTSDCY